MNTQLELYEQFTLEELKEIAKSKTKTAEKLWEALSPLRKAKDLLPSNNSEAIDLAIEQLDSILKIVGTECDIELKLSKAKEEAINYRENHLETKYSPYFTTYQRRDAEETREILKEIFKELRKEGFVCRMNHMCCGGCSSAEIGSHIDKLYKEKGILKKGGFHYDIQAEVRKWDSRWDGWEYDKKGILFLSWGNAQIDHWDDKKKKTIVDVDPLLTMDEVGAIFVEKLKKHEVSFLWDGNETGAFMLVFADKNRAEYVEKAVNDYYKKQKKNKKKE